MLWGCFKRELEKCKHEHFDWWGSQIKSSGTAAIA